MRWQWSLQEFGTLSIRIKIKNLPLKEVDFLFFITLQAKKSIKKGCSVILQPFDVVPVGLEPTTL